jgi:hypothetical protein
VLKFEVNYAPFLLTEVATFSPKPGAVLPTRQVNLNIIADDIDPRDPGVLQHPVGGPTASKLFRYTVAFRGLTAGGVDTTISPLDLFRLPGVNIPSYPIPSQIVSTSVQVLVEVCDCTACEDAPGTGKCVSFTLPVTAPAPFSLLRDVPSSRSGPGLLPDSRSDSP